MSYNKRYFAVFFYLILCLTILLQQYVFAEIFETKGILSPTANFKIDINPTEFYSQNSEITVKIVNKNKIPSFICANIDENVIKTNKDWQVVEQGGDCKTIKGLSTVEFKYIVKPPANRYSVIKFTFNISVIQSQSFQTFFKNNYPETCLEKNDTDSFKLYSRNVGKFYSLQNVQGNREKLKDENKKKVAESMPKTFDDRIDADIIAFQELSYWEQTDDMLGMLKQGVCFEIKCWNFECIALRKNRFGSISEINKPDMGSDRYKGGGCKNDAIPIYVDAKDNFKNEIRIINVHLNSPADDPLPWAKCRKKQIVDLFQNLAKDKHSIIVGDFNFQRSDKIDYIDSNGKKQKPAFEEFINNNNFKFHNEIYKIASGANYDHIISNFLPEEINCSEDRKNIGQKLGIIHPFDHPGINCQNLPISQVLGTKKNTEEKNTKPLQTTTILAIDVSASMNEPHGNISKMEAAKESVRRLLKVIKRENEVNAQNEVGIVAFSNSAIVLEPPSTDTYKLQTALDSLLTQQLTNIGDALTESISELSHKDGKKIIVLLTDGKITTGPSRDEVINNIAQEAKNQDINIKIFTIGLGDPQYQNSIDEDLLKQISFFPDYYKYGDTPLELQNLYIQMRHNSIGKSIAMFDGNISQGEQKNIGTFDVAYAMEELFITLNWPGSYIDMTLKDPSGKIVDAAYHGASVWKDEPPVTYIIKKPAFGKWSASIVGSNIPDGTEPYQMIASGRKRELIATMGGGVGSIITNTQNYQVAILIFLSIMILGIMILIIAIIIKRNNQTSIPASTYYLHILHGSSINDKLPLTLPVTTIGRNSDNNIILKDDTVSGHHAKIIFDGQSFLIEDINSSNGTYINSNRINKTILLPDDKIRIGEIVFSFYQT